MSLNRTTYAKIYRKGRGTPAQPPVITSPSSATVSEGVGLLLTLTANVPVAWEIRPGLDGALFSMAGADQLALPGPTADGVYQVRVRATRTTGSGLNAEQTISVTVVPLTITSPAAISGPPGTALSQVLTANEPVVWSISGGANSADFTISGDLLTLPDTKPEGLYFVQVQATSLDSLRTANLDIEATLDDGVAAGDVAVIVPGPLWDGTAGSGWGGARPAVIARTGPQCPLRPITLDEEVIGTAEMYIGARTGAFGGLQKVEILCEGATFDVTDQIVHTYPAPRGGPDEILIGNFGKFVRDAMPDVYGTIELFWRATPNDPTILPMVFGPLIFYFPSLTPGPVSMWNATTNPAGKFGRVIELAKTPAEIVGSRYRKWVDAAKYAKNNLLIGAIIYCTETGDYAPRSGESTSVGSNNTGGRIITTQAPGVTCTMTNVGPRPPTSNLYYRNRTGYNGLHFKMIEWDQEGFETLYYETTGRQVRHVFEGCRIYNSMGPWPLFQGGYPGQPIAISGIYLDNLCENLRPDRSMQSTPLARNNTLVNIPGDIFTLANCAVGNRMTDLDQQYYRQNHPSVTIAYTGAGVATHRRERDPGFTGDATDRNVTSDRFILAVDAVDVLNVNLAGTNSTLAALVNAVPNFAMVDLYPSNWSSRDDRMAASLTVADRGKPWPATAVTSTPQNIGTTFDVHSDFNQATTSPKTNVVICENWGLRLESQTYFWTQSGLQKDTLFENNAIYVTIGAGLSSQISVALSHVLFRHNDLLNQSFIFSGTVEKCEGYGNAMGSLKTEGSPDMTWWDRNHAGSVLGTAATQPTNMIVGGSNATLYVDADNGDMRPKVGGPLELLANRIPPKTKFDRRGNLRAASDARGAYSINALAA